MREFGENPHLNGISHLFIDIKKSNIFLFLIKMPRLFAFAYLYYTLILLPPATGLTGSNNKLVRLPQIRFCGTN